MTQETPSLYCANHPTRETTLRCNRCEKPICVQCAIQTPTGYRCRECVRGQLKVFETAVWYDYLLGFAVSALLSLIASLLVSLLGIFFWGLLVLVAAPAAAVAIARIVQLVLRKHRGRALFLTCAAGVLVGGLPVGLVQLFQLLAALGGGIGFNLFSLLPLAWQVVYLATAVPAVYYNLSGIRLFK